MKRNHLRDLLNDDKPTLGTHVNCPWPGMIEVIGHSGAFDYIEYVAEYSPVSVPGLDELGRALDLFPRLSSMIKVEESMRAWIAPRAVDSGFESVLFADVRTAEEARECVASVRSEHPDAGGVHGTGMRRVANYFMYGGSQDWVDYMNNIVIVLMIEKKQAIDNLDEILDVPGVDMLQFGPSDYSISVGQPRPARSEETQQAGLKVIETALKKGIRPRIEAGSVDQLKRHLDLGVRDFCVGWDVGVVFGWAREQQKMWDELGVS